ncbi:unnamed protein product [Coccothraustes coccothraustes]
MALRRQLVAQSCLGQAALPSLAHLLPCSWFNDRKRSPRYPGPAASTSCLHSQVCPPARPPGSSTHSGTPSEEREERKMKSIRPTCRKLARWMEKEANRSSVLKCGPRKATSSVQNAGGTFSSSRAQDNSQASCGGLQVWSSSTRLVHHQETKLL